MKALRIRLPVQERLVKMKPEACHKSMMKRELITVMEKMLIIEASPRKGFSSNVAEEISAQLGDRCAPEVVALRDLDIRPCTGYTACFFAGSSKCPQKRDDVARGWKRWKQRTVSSMSFRTMPLTFQDC